MPGLEAAWTDPDANTMRNFCSQFTMRLEAVGKANWGYFEWDQLKQMLSYNTKSILENNFFVGTFFDLDFYCADNCE